jgi:NAD(P)-dependent dehydrogenase (short-subunit alcohol dehydrogenase family)
MRPTSPPRRVREALIRCVANQYGPQGIRANVLSPGFTLSPMTEQSFAVPGLAAMLS